MTESPRSAGSHPARFQGFGRRPAVAEPELPAPEAAHRPAAVAERRGSYIARHWRGELSLGTAYWINGILVGVLFVALTGGVDYLVGRHFTPIAWLVYLIAFWMAQIALLAWQSLGIWRSARAHPDHGGRRFWAVTAKVMVALGLISSAYEIAQRGVPQIDEALRIVAGDAEIGNYQVALADGGKIIDVRGGITFGLTDKVQALLDANPDVRVVRLHSPGGRIAEARQLRELVRQRQLWTYVMRDCMSACTTVFLGGVQRWVDHKARIGFHRPFAAGMYEFEMERAYRASYRDLVKWGVAPNFAERAMSTPSTSIWIPTMDELMFAKVVTAAGSPEALAARLRAPETPKDAEHVLTTHPLFRLIARHEPLAMDDIRSEIVYNFTGEKTLADVIGRVHPQLTRLHYKYLPMASDAAVAEGARVLIEQLRQMRDKHSWSCAYFMNQHRHNGIRTDVGKVFDEALVVRLAAAIQGSIEIADATANKPPTRDAGEPLVDKLFAHLAAAHGRDVEVFGQLEAMTVDAVKACTMMEKLFEAALAMPDPERVTALRYLFVLRR